MHGLLLPGCRSTLPSNSLLVEANTLGLLTPASPHVTMCLACPVCMLALLSVQNVKWHLRKLRVKAARQQGVARNAGSQASLSQAVAGVGQPGGAVPLRAADSSPAAIKGECHSGRLADNATGPLASAAASWQLGAHETAAAALVSEASGSSVNVPGTAAAQRAELLQQQLMAAPGVAAAAMASAAAVVTSATVGAAAAVPPQPDATPPISSVGWELFLLQSTLRALDLHRIHGVIVQQLEAALLRMIAELEQLVAWQRSACSDSPSAMPQSLESLAQYLRENQQLPDSTDQGTFGSWGSNPAADKEDSAIAVPATSEQTQTQTQIPHPVAPGSDRPHCIETCDIPGCHFCLYELRRRLRRAGQGSNMEPDPPAPE